MESSNVYTALPIIQVLVWGSRYASESCSGKAEECGWNPNSVKGPPFSLPFPERENSRCANREADCTILLVEDNPADADLVHEALVEHGVSCELICLNDGEQAFNFVESIEAGEAPRPDLVILDLNLPRKPGARVLERLRQSSVCSHIPVAVLTSSNNQKDRDEAARLGASIYIRKPSRLSELLALGKTFKDMIGK